MLETLAWERDIDLSGPKALSASNPNLNLGSTQNTSDLNQSMSRPQSPSRPPSPPPPQFVMSDFPTPSSIPQRLTGDRKPTCRSELSELRSRPSFVDYEDLEVFRHLRPLTMASSVSESHPIRRTSMMPVDADGYRDLLLDVDYHYQDENKRKRANPIISHGTSNTSIKSKSTETTTC